jgi:hypothetical protein
MTISSFPAQTLRPEYRGLCRPSGTTIQRTSGIFRPTVLERSVGRVAAMLNGHSPLDARWRTMRVEKAVKGKLSTSLHRASQRHPLCLANAPVQALDLVGRDRVLLALGVPAREE